MASFSTRLPIVQIALKLQPDTVNVAVSAGEQAGLTPLMIAALTSNVPITKALLNAGASVNTILGETGWRAYHISCQKGNIEIMKLLIENGADMNSMTLHDPYDGVDSSETCKQIAMRGKQADVLLFLETYEE